MVTLRLVLEGERGAISIDEFLGGIGTAIEILREVERSVAQGRRGRLEWRIEDLAASSAATAIVAQATDELSDADADEVTRIAIQGLQHLEDHPGLPPFFGDEAVRAVRRLAEALGRDGARTFRAVREGLPGYEVTISRQAADNAAKTLQVPVTTSLGSVVGRLDAINLHERTEVSIYDDLHRRAVRCRFPLHLLPAVKDALGRRVEASGQIFREPDGRVRRLVIDALKVLPDDAELPTVEDVRSIAPGLTGDMTSEEYLRWARDA